jgi:hypothetical protein
MLTVQSYGCASQIRLEPLTTLTQSFQEVCSNQVGLFFNFLVQLAVCNC